MDTPHQFNHWHEAREIWDNERWPNFSPMEAAQRGDGWMTGKSPLIVIPEFVDLMQELREHYGAPIPVSSWYRSPDYNERNSSTGRLGPHTTGRAVDIPLYGRHAHKLVKCAMRLGFTGIGIKQKGPYSKRFIHLDNLADRETVGPRPWIWTY